MMVEPATKDFTTDRIVRTILVLAAVALAISLLRHPHGNGSTRISDNGVVPPALLQGIQQENAIRNRPTTAMNFTGSSLQAALQQMASATNTPIQVDWETVENAGIDRQKPISLQLRAGTLGNALDAVCECAVESHQRMDFEIQGGTIRLSTEEAMTKNRSAEVYNIRTLIARMQSGTNHGKNAPASFTDDDAVQQIHQLILDTVTTNQWSATGGMGDLREIGGLLIVTGTPRAQREVATLLTRLDAELGK